MKFNFSNPFNEKKEEEMPVVQAHVEAESEQTIAEPVIQEEAKEVIKPIRKTTIGEGITFYGNFHTADPMEINGAVEGDIKSSSSIEITRSGAYRGDASMSDLTLEGDITGNVVVDNLSRLAGTAYLDGNLKTNYLITDNGSVFTGSLELGSANKKAAPKAEVKPAEPEEAEEEALDWSLENLGEDEKADEEAEATL